MAEIKIYKANNIGFNHKMVNLIERWRMIPYNQRGFILIVLGMWTFSTVGFVVGEAPLSELEGRKPTILNVEASLRSYLRGSDNALLAFLDALYTSPVEIWWKMTKQWSVEMVTMLARHGIDGERAIQALRNWYLKSPQERLDDMVVAKIPVYNLMDYLDEMKLHDSRVYTDITNFPESVTKLKALQQHCNTTSCISEEIGYDWEEVEEWSLGYHAKRIGWDAYDPYNRDKQRGTYKRLLALSKLYQTSDIQEWERRFETQPVDMDNIFSLAYGVGNETYGRARDDWHITDGMMARLGENSRLATWFKAQETRTLDAIDVAKSLNALNLYLQSHDTNAIGWMNTASIMDLRGKRMEAYATDPLIGEVGRNCLNIGRGVCLS